MLAHKIHRVHGISQSNCITVHRAQSFREHPCIPCANKNTTIK